MDGACHWHEPSEPALPISGHSSTDSIAMGCHHPQGLLISSPRGCSISMTTWTQLLSNFPLPAAILLVTGPFGALISVFSSLTISGISLRLLSSKSFWCWGGEPSGSSTSLALICLIGCNRFLCKILGLASRSPCGQILNTGISG